MKKEKIIQSWDEKIKYDPEFFPGPYEAIAYKCRMSSITIRRAFARKPIPVITAIKIAAALNISVKCFRSVEDMRGRKKNKKISEKQNENHE